MFSHPILQKKIQNFLFFWDDNWYKILKMVRNKSFVQIAIRLTFKKILSYGVKAQLL